MKLHSVRGQPSDHISPPSRRDFLGLLPASMASLAWLKSTGHGTGSLQVPQIPRIREANNTSPRLKIFDSKWSLIGLPRGGKEWGFEDKLLKIKEAGFDGIETE